MIIAIDLDAPNVTTKKIANYFRLDPIATKYGLSSLRGIFPQKGVFHCTSSWQ
jgi:hypothetical protein